MKLLEKLLALFRAKPAPTAPSPLYSDAEFLDVMMELARKRTRQEQAARDSKAGTEPTQPQDKQAAA
jgi:hypothetical protein